MRRNLLEEYKIYDCLDNLNRKCRENGYKGKHEVLSGLKKEQPLEKNLAPWIPDYKHDPDYVTIQKFQQETLKEEQRRKDRAIEKITSIAPKYFGTEDAEVLAVRLRDISMRVVDIVKVVGKNKSWYDRSCKNKVRKPARAYDAMTIACNMEEDLREARLWKRGVKVC